MPIRPLILACLPLIALAPPALAWTFTPLPICTMEQVEAEVTVQVTYDPATEVYAIHLDRAAGWPPAAVFSIRFEGAAPLTISTNRHAIDGPRLTVTDRGFGNVLTGMARNTTGMAILGDLTVPFTLERAAEAVEDFRACPSEGLV